VAKKTTKPSLELVTDVLGEFLKSPPDGTPTEVIEAFDVFRRNSDRPIPPHLFYEVVEQAPVAVSITDPHANILYSNHAFETLTGYQHQDVLGKNESILSNKATPAELYQELWRTITGRHSWSGTLVNRRKNGESYLAELTISPVLDHAGNITNFLGMHRDVSEEHKLQRQFAHQKALIETVLDMAPVVVALLDDQGKVLLDNQEYKKLLSDLKTREPAMLLLQALTEQADLPFEDLRAGRRDFRNLEVRLEVPGAAGPRWFSCSGTWTEEPDLAASAYFMQPAGNPHNLLLLAHETTQQRRESERARIQHLSATLAEQQRVCGMREALAAATFQIQKPLNLVNAATAMLRRTGADDNALLPVLEQIGESAQQAFEALNAALPEETPEARQMVNINALLQELLELSTEALLGAGIVVAWQPTFVLPNVLGQKKQLRGLFKNLIDNAIQALGEVRSGQRDLTIRTRQRNRTLIIEIEDNGPGIAADDRMTVFEPLYSNWKNKRGHAGMGLAMAQEIANAHGGVIEIDGDVASGCLMRVVLPVDEA